MRLLVAILLAAAAAPAQTNGSIGSPVLGMVLDPDAGALRTIDGIPGAARLGGVIDGAADLATAAASGAYALYPVELRGTLTLTFAPDTGLPDDPSIQFQNGSRAVTFTVPAGAPAQIPAVRAKTGTVAGVITITLTFTTAAGQNVTPAGIAPQRITVARAAPGLASVACARNPSGFTVTIDGYTNTREAVQATFDFTAAQGATLGTTQLALQTGSLFSAWFASAGASGVGGVFRYKQPFTVLGNASSITGVTLTLGNSVGTSATASCQLP